MPLSCRALSLTCTVDGLAHLVSDAAATAGVAARKGTYAALCGHTVHAAAMVCSAGQPCPRCALHVTPLGAGEPRRRRARPFRLRRLLGRDST